MRDAHQTVELVARTAYGRLVALLASRTRDVAAAEDALGEALLQALTSWPRDGVPANPSAWLLTAARHRLLDQQRRAHAWERCEAVLRELPARADEPESVEAFPDERLRLLFVCAHPAIDPALHAPLLLQLVLGLDAARIAPVFLVSPAAMSQRLVRAKTKIREAAISFDLPGVEELPARLSSVLEAIYAAYGIGWDDVSGADPSGRDLAEEALWLARVLVQLLPQEPEARGLLALILFCESRRPARRSAAGEYVPLSAQDPSLWNEGQILAAEAELEMAARLGAPHGRFQIEAAIQSVHADRRRTGLTDWKAIAFFYEHLVCLSPTLGARIGHALAVAAGRGPAEGLELLDRIPCASVATYQPYWAARAHLAQLHGRDTEAATAYELAISLAQDDAVRRFLLQRRG